MTVDGSRYRWKTPGGLGKALQVLLVAAGILGLLIAVVLAIGFSRRSLVFHVPGPNDPAGTVVFPSDMRWFGLLWVPSLISQATVVIWLIWQHQATANLWARGLRDLRTSPGWAVGWWFVPFAWYVMPFLAVREIDVRSSPDGAPRRASPLLGWWWAAWIGAQAGPLIGMFGFAFPAMFRWAQTIQNGATSVDLAPFFRPLLPWVVLGGVLQAMAGIFAWQVVARIDSSQSAMAAAPAIPPRPDRAF